jgi:outer membrane protein TolC
MTIRDAVLTAFANNKEIKIQEKEIKAAKAQRLGAVSNFLPKVNASGSYTRNDAVLGGIFTGAEDLDKDIGVFTGYQNNLNAGLAVNQPIYTGGANLSALKKAELQIKVQEETLRARKLDVEFETRRLYYGLLLARENECIARNLVVQAQAHCDDVEQKFVQGTSSRFDLLQSKVHVSLLLPQLVKATNAIDLQDAELKKLLSLKMQDRIVQKDNLEAVPVAIDEEAFLSTALVQKPEVILRTLGIDISEWSVAQARATHLPQAGASLNYMFQSDSLGNMFNSQHNLWNAGVAVTVPLFDGFFTKSKVDEAWARYAQAGLAKENTLEQVAVDIKRACLDLQQSQAIIDSQKDNIVQAKEALRISEVSYDNGVGTNLDVLDALVSLSQAEQYLAGGIYDYIMAKAYLDRTMGENLVKEE